jgi:hypothetical protein
MAAVRRNIAAQKAMRTLTAAGANALVQRSKSLATKLNQPCYAAIPHQWRSRRAPSALNDLAKFAKNLAEVEVSWASPGGRAFSRQGNGAREETREERCQKQ